MKNNILNFRGAVRLAFVPIALEHAPVIERVHPIPASNQK